MSAQDKAASTQNISVFPSDLRPSTVSPLAKYLSSDADLAKHLLSVAEDSRATANVELAEHFVELAYDLLNGAFGEEQQPS